MFVHESGANHPVTPRHVEIAKKLITWVKEDQGGQWEGLHKRALAGPGPFAELIERVAGDDPDAATIIDTLRTGEEEEAIWCRNRVLQEFFRELGRSGMYRSPWKS